MQHFLNASFAAEAATHKYVELVNATAIDALSEPAACSEAASEARRRNLDILSGKQGEIAMKACCAMLVDYQIGSWANLAMDRAQRFRLACALLLSAGEAYMRLVFSYQQPKFQIFEVGREEEFNDERVKAVAQPIVTKKEKCAQCVDRFSHVWAKRAVHPNIAVRKRAFRSLKRMVHSFCASDKQGRSTHSSD